MSLNKVSVKVGQNPHTAAEVASFYEAEIPKIFGGDQERNWISACFTPKYKTDRLRTSLTHFFGEKTLRDVCTDVCVTAVTLQNAKPRFYKSDYKERNLARVDEKLVEVAIATSAAPSYFESHTMSHSTNLVDGGICANNPALVGLVESCQFERPSKKGTTRVVNFGDDLVMLSIGTGEQPAMPYDATRLGTGGWMNWARPITEILFESQAQIVDSQAQFLLGSRYFRVNPRLRFPMKLDDTEKLNELKNLADLTGDLEQFLARHFGES